MNGEDSLFAKCAWRLIPFMVLLYLVNFIDRVNVGFAALTMNADLGFTPQVYGFGVGIFFFSYALLQVPANIALEKIGARRWMAIIVATWGAISAANALVRDPTSFYALRFLLGVAEAGFFPGMIYYLTLWFPREYRARFTAAFVIAQPLSFIVGGPLSSLVLGLDGAFGLRGWQLLFLIEGLPAVLLGLAVLKWLPDGPKDAPWLSTAEKQTIAARLAAEEAGERSAPWPALRDPRVIALGLVLLGQNAAAYGVQLWLPQIVQAMGFSTRATGFVVALPFVALMLAMVFIGRSSDRKRERVRHIAAPLLIAASGLAVASVSPADIVVLIGLTVAVICIDAGLGPFWSLPSSFLSGAAAAGGIALIRTIGAFGGFVGPAIVGVLREDTGDYAAAMAGLGFVLALSAFAVLGLSRALVARAA